MEEVTINIYPILQFIVILFAIIGGYWCLQNIVTTIVNFLKDLHFKDKDVEVVTDAFAKIGEVKNGTENEKILNAQNVENNKEIHSNNLRQNQLETRIEHLENCLNDLNNEIQEQLKDIIRKLN